MLKKKLDNVPPRKLFSRRIHVVAKRIPHHKIGTYIDLLCHLCRIEIGSYTSNRLSYILSWPNFILVNTRPPPHT